MTVDVRASLNKEIEMKKNNDSYITIEVDHDLYKDLSLWCKENNPTPEEIAEIERKCREYDE